MKSKWDYLTDDDFFNFLRKLYEENPKNLLYDNFKRNMDKNIPSIKSYFYRFKSKTWSEIIEIAGIKKHKTAYSEKEAIDNLLEFAKLLNKTPSQNDFSKYKWKPSYGWYYKHFGSYSDLCNMIGLTPNEIKYANDITIKYNQVKTEEEINKIFNDSIYEIKRISIFLNKCPTTYEYTKYKTKGYSVSVLKRRFNKTFMQLCSDVLCDEYSPKLNSYNKVNFINYHDKDEVDKLKLELGNKLMTVCEEIGHPPRMTKLSEYGLRSFTVYHRLFGYKTYNEILKELGISINNEKPYNYTDEELLTMYYNLFVKLNKLPSAKDISKDKNMPSIKVYLNRFKNTINICNLLNIDYEKYINVGLVGNNCLDNNNDLCRSFGERDITNFFILNNIKYEKEVSYSEIIKGDNRRFDWKIYTKDSFYYVEYFGMYEYTKDNLKLGEKYKNKAQRKIIDLKKYNILNNCIFIYYEDICSKPINKIFEPYLKIKLINLEYQIGASFKKYKDLTDEELLSKVFEYYEDKNKFPNVKSLIKNNYPLYKEIMNRYSFIYNFAIKYGYNNVRKPRNYK